MKENSLPFSGDASANSVYEIFKIYDELIYIKELYDKLTPEQKEGLSFQFKDYTNELQDAKAQLAEFSKLAASMHYKEGIQYEGSQLREENLIAARAFKTADLYVPSYEDTKERLQKVYPLAVCYLGIGDIKNNSGKGNFLTQELRNSIHILSAYPIQKKYLPYFKLLSSEDGYSDKANVRFEAVITNIIVSRESNEPFTKDREEEIDDNGQKKKVSAKVTFHGKSMQGKAEGLYSIIDLQTGKVIESKPFMAGDSWHHSWTTFTGDIRALKKSDRRGIEDKDKPYPTDQSIIDGIIRNAAGNLANVIERFANIFR